MRKKPLMKMSEAQLQNNVLDLARVHGWLSYHTYDSRRSQPGFPDLVLVHPVAKRTLFRELKSDAGRVSPAQHTWIATLRAAGQDVGTWWPHDWHSGVIQSELNVGRDRHAAMH